MKCKIFKSAKDNRRSFTITSNLIDTIYNKARQVKKKGELILAIPCNDEFNYVLDCKISKIKK